MQTLKIVVCPNRRTLHAPTFRWKDNTDYPSAVDVLQKLDEGGLWLLLMVAGGKFGEIVLRWHEILTTLLIHHRNLAKNAPIYFC